MPRAAAGAAARAEDPVRLLELREAPLSVDEVLAAVRAPGVGGTAVFVGSVRDDDEGRGVRQLGYSAHPTAEAVMREVADRVSAACPGVLLAAVHRVGDLAVGDLAVVVAAGAAHRAEAFEAARRLIDDLKHQVPIWKHQRFADGTEEWVGAPG
jgi:molybdopterin synthase catalytic subunit